MAKKSIERFRCIYMFSALLLQKSGSWTAVCLCLYTYVTSLSHERLDVIHNKYFKGVSVVIATDYGLEFPDSIPGRETFFSSPQRPDLLWGPPSLLSNGCRLLSPRGVKRQEREANYSPPSSAEVKKGVAITPLPLMSSWNSV
jgi:hypothetical protein